jgi:hypothetical protein
MPQIIPARKWFVYQEVARNMTGLRNITLITNLITIINRIYQEGEISLITPKSLIHTLVTNVGFDRQVLASLRGVTKNVLIA